MSGQSTNTEGKKILFICLGNICRSPIAEAVFSHHLKERGLKASWHVDSAAIGDWHQGKPPDSRARSIMKRHNIEMNHRARQITEKDFTYFDIIFGKDEENIHDLKKLAPPSSTAKIELFGSYDPEKELIIRDPYYDDGNEGFEKCYEQCVRCTKGFLDSIA